MTSHDGTAVIERLDADPDCDGLLPASAPDAVSATVPGATCAGTGVSEGEGHVAVRDGNDFGVEIVGEVIEREAFTPDGQPEDTFALRSFGFAVTDDAPALSQADGWLGVRAWGRSTFAPVELHAIAPDGTERRVERFDNPTLLVHEWGIAEDPLGGALVWQHWHGDGCGGDARRFSSSGAPQGSPAPVGGCNMVGGVVSNRGEALVIEQTTADPLLHWLRPDGTPARPPASDPTLHGVSHVRMAPLLDGSIAVDAGAGWTRRYPHLADQTEPAPAWLAAAPPRFRNTRGNRGYAFFAGAPDGAPPPSNGCSQRVEIRAPSGRLCGAVTLRNPGGACTPGLADQGWDGTVVERNARASCAWRWWPRLLGP